MTSKIQKAVQERPKMITRQTQKRSLKPAKKQCVSKLASQPDSKNSKSSGSKITGYEIFSRPDGERVKVGQTPKTRKQTLSNTGRT